MDYVDVIKYDLEGIEKWRYPAKVLQRDAQHVLLEAWFDRSTVEVAGLKMARGDRFLEVYFSDRWYNIFEIYNGQQPVIKGWYCNIATPAAIRKETISYIDLAIDLVILTSGQQIILDQDEFEALCLDEEKKKNASAALIELQTRFIHIPPRFDLATDCNNYPPRQRNHPNFDFIKE